MKLEISIAHIGVGKDKRTGSISTPIYQVATFEHPCIGESTGFDYSRSGNPTRKVLEEGIAELEGGDRGFAFSSGMAAVVAIITLFSSGDHIVVTEDAYGGTYRVLSDTYKKFGVEVSFVDTSSLEAVENSIKKNTRAIIIESPTNPLLKVADLKGISKLSKKHNLLCVVDNTFMTPLYQKPLDLGADIVIHSASKYLGGHNDLIAGLVVTKGKELSLDLYNIQNATGAVIGPQDAFLLIRGIKTLSVRMERQVKSTEVIANWLVKHPKVKHVYYPGFLTHVGHQIQMNQAKSFGAMLAFEMYSAEDAKQVINQIKLIKFAESLGGVESLMTYPCTQTHMDMPEDFRNRLGITDALLRFSVGIEHEDDLIEDLKIALEV